MYGRNFPVESNHYAIALGILFSFDLHVEINGAHDTITELLMDKRFDGRTVDLNKFIEPIDGWVHRHGAVQ